MPSKTNMTSDGDHVQFGNNDNVPMPPGFNAPDNGEFCPQYFGRVMQNPDNAGFGAAYMEAYDSEDSDE